MGEVAARFSDITIVTSDNPRTEAADSILEDILPGVHQHFERELSLDEVCQGTSRGYRVVLSRREAIYLAINALQKGDLLLVAGKGHEDYQIIGTEKTRFDDREEILNALTEAAK